MIECKVYFFDSVLHIGMSVRKIERNKKVMLWDIYLGLELYNDIRFQDSFERM